MLLLHGFPEDWAAWRHQIATLKDEFEIAALDLRGFGQSDAPSGVINYSMARLCADVVAVIDAFGRPSCYIAAHNFGAAVAWCVAANYPERVERLAILCCPHPAAFKDPECFDSCQARSSCYILLFMARGIPEAWLRARDFELLDRLILKPPSGARNAGRITTWDVERYKVGLSRPGALTAAVNYYRASLRDQTKDQSHAVEK